MMKLILFLLFFVTQIAIADEFEFKNFEFKKGKILFTYKVEEFINIYLADFATLKVSQLTTAGQNEYSAFSPNGQEIVFVSDRSGTKQIYLMNLDGTNQRQISYSREKAQEPTWSPDGKTIYFTSGADKTANIFKFDIASTEVESKMPQEVSVKDPSVSDPKKDPIKPKVDSQFIKYTQVTTGDKIKNFPKISPDGNLLVYTTNEYWPGWDIESLDLTTKRKELITHGYDSYTRATFSPDGLRIIFSANIGDEVLIKELEKGKGMRTLIQQGGKNYDGIFTSDGNKILFSGQNEEGKFEIMSYDIVTEEITPLLAAKGSIRYLSWNPN